RPIRGRRLPPPVIQACILRKVRENIVRNVGRESRCVITVPAYFDETRRKATADAGEMAGLRVRDILNEPTAAAIAFGESLGYLSAEGGSRRPMNVLVFDLGGGTFDVTLVHLEPGRLDTLAIDGEMELGGYDWDLALLDDLADEMVTAGFADPRDDPARWAKVYQAVVEAKLALSARRKTRLRVMLDEGFFETEISRTRFERCTADLLERTALRAQNVVEAAGMTWEDVDEVLLVGGATRMPMIPEMLEALAGKKPRRNVNPDEAVARGAAIYAGYLLSEEYPELPVAAFKVVEVNAHTLGVEGIDPSTGGKTKIPVIPRNSKLPVSKTEVFCTERENQDSLAVPVIEGESPDPAACSRIGTVVIERLPPGLPKG
ncbi:MAG: Hsp70 family protein, partial [Planctomycetota bacterium]